MLKDVFDKILFTFILFLIYDVYKVLNGIFTFLKSIYLSELQSEHVYLKYKYLFVYFFLVFGDWLQGPYLYSLYDSFGYTQNQIAFLFLIGFISSLSLGSYVSSLADVFGTKKLTLLYAVFYSLSCFTSHFRNLYINLFGRILGGICTSLLNCVIQSWLVQQYDIVSLKKNENEVNIKLKDIFSEATLMSYFVAVLAGLFGDSLVERFKPFEAETGLIFGGFTAPFDLAILMLCLGASLCYFFWPDAIIKYNSSSFLSNVSLAMWTILSDSSIVRLGLIESFFEASLYCFIFIWPPTLLKDFDNLPLGKIFAIFMLSAMIGSRLSKSNFIFSTDKSKLITINILSLLTFIIGPLKSIFDFQFLQFWAFVLFEGCVGAYFPIMGSMKSKLIKDNDIRSTIYTLFRIPLNILVIIVMMSNLKEYEVSLLCGGFLFCSFALSAGLKVPE